MGGSAGDARGLAEAEVASSEVSHVNAHGTSTEVSDRNEILAIRSGFVPGEARRAHLRVTVNNGLRLRRHQRLARAAAGRALPTGSGFAPR